LDGLQGLSKRRRGEREVGGRREWRWEEKGGVGNAFIIGN